MSFFIFVLLVLVGFLFLKWRQAQNSLEGLKRRLDVLERHVVRLLDRSLAPAPATAAAPARDPASAAPSTVPAPQPAPAAMPPPLPGSPFVPVGVPAEEMAVPSYPAIATPTVRASDVSTLGDLANPAQPATAASTGSEAGTMWPGSASKPVIPRAPSQPVINWESFLGVKLFAWVGGLALFLAVAFFVKYSFEHNLISAQLRVAIGYTVGLGLIVGGLWMPRQRHLVTVQSLCATGVLVLYAATFAAQAHYGFFGVLRAFGIMSLVTVVAFLLAIRLDAQVVAVLGLLGGFITPWLLRTGHDNPAGLFGYLALLDIGLIAVVLRQRWNYLALVAALATAVMQFGWVATFFVEFKLLTAMTIFAGFAGLFLAAFGIARRLDRVSHWIGAAAAVPALAGLIFAAYLLWHPYPAIATRVWLMLGFILLLDLPFLVLAWWRNELRPVLHAAGALVFLLLMSWTAKYLKPELLNSALAFYLLFAIQHAALPLVLERLRPSPRPMVGWIHVFPSLALILILVPLFNIAGPSFWVWPVVLFIDVLAIVLAAMTASLVSLLAVLLLTVLGTAAWIFQLPAELPGVPGMLTVVGGFAVFFMGAALLTARRVFGGAVANAADAARKQEIFSQIACLSAGLPFLLLTLVVLRLPLANPSAVFGLAALLTVLLLGVALRCAVDWLAVVALGSVLLVEHVWHFHRFAPDHFGLAASWYLGFSALFFVFPFLFRSRLQQRILPWVTSALALPLHFTMLYRGFRAAFPEFALNGLLPALLALPCLAGLFYLVAREKEAGPERLGRWALLGGAALFFITLVIPIQFERQWITLGWALEGTALLWLFHRVPHPGLRLVGVALLVVGFVRLALNPWVVSAYGRTGTPIWNWYLYTYGVVAVCLMVGGWLLAPPRHRLSQIHLPPVLYSLGTVLLFILLNIEIADFFSPPGGTLVFNFSAGFAQDMTYSLAWGLFAFVVLAVGFRLRHAATRYAGMGLLVVTLLKLFFHDLWRLGGLHRIGSLVGLAVVLILASFFYQRFLSAGETPREDSQAP